MNDLGLLLKPKIEKYDQIPPKFLTYTHE